MNYLFVNQASARFSKKKLIEFLDYTFAELNRKVPKAKTELTIAFVSEEQMRSLNKTYRKKDYATDVLSFESPEPESLGELALSYDVLKSQAKDHKITVYEEICYMLVHGVLHLLGYDHEKGDKEASKMYRLQDKIFNSYFRSREQCPSKPNRRKSKPRSRTARKK